MHFIFKFLLVLLTVNYASPSTINSATKYTTIDYLKLNGYPAESHYVTTSDGYILNLHRIPAGINNSNGKVVLLEHGIWASSFQWLLSGPRKGLAFLLADTGYDVWMGNARGSSYSRNHTTLNPDTDSKFWEFSWHEIGIYDLPASIDYILEVTNSSSLYYVGHSQGTTSMYVMASELPEYNTKIKFYTHLAPIAFMGHLRSPPFKILAGLQAVVPNIIESIFGMELLPDNGLFHQFASGFCSEPMGAAICEAAMFLTFGFSPEETNATLVSLFFVQYPAGASWMQLTHYLQGYNSGHFRQYDYGSLLNVEKYGSITPPDYDLRKLTAPGCLFYSTNDWVGDYITDIPELYSKLGNGSEEYQVPIASFNHMDHLLGINATSLVFDKVLELFNQH